MSNKKTDVSKLKIMIVADQKTKAITAYFNELPNVIVVGHDKIDAAQRLMKLHKHIIREEAKKK